LANVIIAHPTWVDVVSRVALIWGVAVMMATKEGLY
jgi:hypothetical protein